MPTCEKTHWNGDFKSPAKEAHTAEIYVLIDLSLSLNEKISGTSKLEKFFSINDA